MNFHPNPYIGPTIKNPKKLIHKLKTGRPAPAILSDTYLLTLAETTGQLEIYAAKYLIQPYYKKHPPFVIGIGKGYDEAVSLVMQIVQESINTRGDCNLKTYLQERSLS